MAGTAFPVGVLIGYLVGGAIVVGTTIWVGVDSESLRRRKLDDKPSWLWVLECLFVWIICFPWYLVHRHRVLRRASRQPAPPPQVPHSAWPPPPPPGWVPPQHGASTTTAPAVQPPPYALSAYGPPTGAPWAPAPPAAGSRSGFTWWLIVMLVLGGVLMLAFFSVFGDQHMTTLDQRTVDCGSALFPRHGAVLITDGSTCAGYDHSALIGLIIIFVIGAVLVLTSLLVRRARLKKMRVGSATP